LAVCGRLSWWGGLALLVAVFANQVHKWAHVPASCVPRSVQLLQAWGVLQTATHHAVHHTGRKDRRYCVVTNVLNPVLDASRFWRLLEVVVQAVSGCRPRPDISQQPYDYPLRQTAGGR
jgi:TMEM189-like protein